MRRLFAFITLLAIPASGWAQHRPLDGAQLRLALDKLTVVGSAMYLAAHPDDENTAMLAWLANDRLYRTAYLSMTRGDGGQNLIGEEKGELLGVIRTQELLAARRIDGAEQYFTRAVDFGYSKSPAETLEIWGHDAVLADVVWNIRRFQPDVIVTRFPTTGEGGHGQHTASATLAMEAFTAAADPTRFSDQLRYVGVWQPKRIFWNRFGRGVEANSPELAGSLRIDLGRYNPHLGRAYTEIAAESRGQHKSQGFDLVAPEVRVTVVDRDGKSVSAVFYYLTQLAGEPAKEDPFEDIDTSWSRYKGGEIVGEIVQKIADEFDPEKPEKSIPQLLRALAALDRLGASPAWDPRINPWIQVKRAELLEAVRGCAGVSIDVSAAEPSVVPGGEIDVSVTVVNRSDYPFILSTVASRYANPGKSPGTPLKKNQPVKTDISVKLPVDYEISQPYWLRKPPTKGLFFAGDQKLIGLAENPPSIPIVVSLADTQMNSLIFTVPAVYRRADPVRGEHTQRVDVVPSVVATLDAKVYLFPDVKPRPVEVSLRSNVSAATGTVRLKAPAGWKVTPESAAVEFKAKGDEARTLFTVTPAGAQAVVTLETEIELSDGRKISSANIVIDHAHIPTQRVFGPASAKAVRVDLKKRGTRIGYISGSGDEIPEALEQAGFEVTELTNEDLDRGDFARFDAIVTGVRAYNTRKSLEQAHAKLLDYVNNGGTLVVQYNSTFPQELMVSSPGPYPITISTARVTVEEAPVKVLKPAHPLMTTPNKITAADFEGWVQERGLYFPGEWDPKYETVIATADPGDKEKPGGQLYARYGKGVFVYTSYSWFRQLPAGVPGAYKMFVNLVSAK